MPLRSAEILVLLGYPPLEAYMNKTRQISVRNAIGMNLLWVGERLDEFLRWLQAFSFQMLEVKFCKLFNLYLRSA